MIGKRLLGGGMLAVAAAGLGLTALHIRQAGPRKADGRTLAQILGKDPQQATPEDIARLSRAQQMQLFYAAPAPQFKSLSGEYEAKVLEGGALGPMTKLFTHMVFPTGMPRRDASWQGKAFYPENGTSGWGYNIFSLGGRPYRARRMRTYMGPSLFGTDKRPSFHLDYSVYNADLIHFMHDEIRQVHANLYICAGFLAFAGGPRNPAPFIMTGPAAPWIGPDK